MNVLELRRRTLGKGVYKKTVEGNPAIAQGSLARRYPGIVMQGWTTQDGTPTPESPVPIVSAGTQNQDTGKWEYEITITNAQTDATKNQTVTLTADRPLTKWDKLEKRNGQWGWVYKSTEVVLDGSEDETWSPNITPIYTRFVIYVDNSINKNERCEVFCNRGFYKHISDQKPYDDYVIFLSAKYMYYTVPKSIIDVNAFREFLSNYPLTVWYETAEETFVPLTAEEQEQMNELYTFRPTTVLSNDCDCNMILTYKTKKSLEVTD